MNFSKFLICCMDKGREGLNQCEQFVDKGGEGQFSRFCADVFLWSTPNKLLSALKWKSF